MLYVCSWQDAFDRAGALFGIGPLPEMRNPLDWFNEDPSNPSSETPKTASPSKPTVAPWSLPIFTEEERRQAGNIMERAAGVGREASDVSSSGELSPQEKRDIIEAELARTEVRFGGWCCRSILWGPAVYEKQWGDLESKLDQQSGQSTLRKGIPVDGQPEIWARGTR
jgi:hypothetical protein